MEKLDLTKKYKSYYTAKTKPALVEIEKAQFLSIKGKGDPASDEFALRVQALYATAYGIKFICKAAQKDFVVAKLEGLWWFDEKKYKNVSITDAPIKIPRSEWFYRLLIRLPDFIKQEYIQTTKQHVITEKELPLAKEIELFTMQEGCCVQMLHVGAFDKEPETLLQMQTFMQLNNLKQNGLHHEIYLSDFRKTAPHKLKTILREPVKGY
ncbi:MAG: GyrI-like domain-containing protein [Fimbriimonadaceae bacterium]|nr:GyrI-like domain-containing protein [Chitinophagales bacterium]